MSVKIVTKRSGFGAGINESLLVCAVPACNNECIPLVTRGLCEDAGLGTFKNSDLDDVNDIVEVQEVPTVGMFLFKGVVSHFEIEWHGPYPQNIGDRGSVIVKNVRRDTSSSEVSFLSGDPFATFVALVEMFCKFLDGVNVRRGHRRDDGGRLVGGYAVVELEDDRPLPAVALMSQVRE